MNIKTLELVHRLLVEEKARVKAAYNEASRASKENESAEDLAERVEKAEHLDAELCGVAVALKDFETTDWN